MGGGFDNDSAGTVAEMLVPAGTPYHFGGVMGINGLPVPNVNQQSNASSSSFVM
jgi:hypothetical protein